MVWLKNLLIELDFRQPELMHMHCDNSLLSTLLNPVFHKKTKHIEVDCQFLRDVWTKKMVAFHTFDAASGPSYQSYLTPDIF